jgi:hypothetical protein
MLARSNTLDDGFAANLGESFTGKREDANRAGMIPSIRRGTNDLTTEIME